MTTIADIKAMLDSLPGPLIEGRELGGGTLESEGATEVDFKLYEGWSLLMANACDNQWGVFNTRLLEHIRGLNVDEEALRQVLEDVQLDDAHWQWLAKSCAHRGDEYRWFFLVAQAKPQAACLIYHPKESAINGEPIFYIEYVAVAPWNRRNPMTPRQFVRVGSTVVKLVSEYAVQTLGLRPGYCLHALPKAVAFYKSLGMIPFPSRDKDSLPYYELPQECCSVVEGAP